MVFEVNYGSLKDVYSSVWLVNILIKSLYPMRNESEGFKSLTINLLHVN